MMIRNEPPIDVENNCTHAEKIAIEEARRELNHLTRVSSIFTHWERMRCGCDKCMSKKAEKAKKADSAIADILNGQPVIGFSAAESLFEWLHPLFKGHSYPAYLAMFKLSRDPVSLHSGLLKMYQASSFSY